MKKLYLAKITWFIPFPNKKSYYNDIKLVRAINRIDAQDKIYVHYKNNGDMKPTTIEIDDVIE